MAAAEAVLGRLAEQSRAAEAAGAAALAGLDERIAAKLAEAEAKAAAAGEAPLARLADRIAANVAEAERAAAGRPRRPRHGSPPGSRRRRGLASGCAPG